MGNILWDTCDYGNGGVFEDDCRVGRSPAASGLVFHFNPPRPRLQATRPPRAPSPLRNGKLPACVEEADAERASERSR